MIGHCLSKERNGKNMVKGDLSKPTKQKNKKVKIEDSVLLSNKGYFCRFLLLLFYDLFVGEILVLEMTDKTTKYQNQTSFTFILLLSYRNFKTGNFSAMN